MARRFVDKVLDYPKRVVERIVARSVHMLTNPIGVFNPSDVTNVYKLRLRLRRGDVLLVCGNARISYVVKVLTLSPWSHVVMYVGDRRDLLTAEEAEDWASRYGEEALKHLVIDADPVRRVHLRPLADFAGLIVRQCRPEALTPEDTTRVIDSALSQLGREYDIKHIVSLLVFFAFPWELLPESFRRFITDFTLSEDDRICSRVLSEAFHSVGYPIRPQLIVQTRSNLHRKALGIAVGLRNRSRSAAKLLIAGRLGKAAERLTDRRYGEIHLKGPRHITPADYDLSRFFSIIKDESDLAFRYREVAAVCPIPN